MRRLRAVVLALVATAFFGCAGILGVEELSFEHVDRADAATDGGAAEADVDDASDAGGDATYCTGWDLCDDFDRDGSVFERLANGSKQGGTVELTDAASASAPNSVLALADAGGTCVFAALDRTFASVQSSIELEVDVQLGTNVGLSAGGNILGWLTEGPDGGDGCDSWLDVDVDKSEVFANHQGSVLPQAIDGVPDPNAWTHVRVALEHAPGGGIRVTVGYRGQPGTTRDFPQCAFGGRTVLHVGLHCQTLQRAARYDNVRIRSR